MKLTFLNSNTILRKQVVEIIKCTRRGHVASALSNIEILSTLYEKVLRVNPKKPLWKDRDRFIMSKGHGCISLYIILAQKGFFPVEELTRMFSFKSFLGGHPQYGKIPGIEASTGSLGHGLSIAVGIAQSAILDHRKYKTYVLLSDGECDEGSVWEAALHASKHQLNNLTVLIDYNKYQCYGKIKDVLPLEPFSDKWRAFGFDVYEVDGHNKEEIYNTLITAQKVKKKPHLIICHTIKGKGISMIENNPLWHHKSKISDQDLELLEKGLVCL
jgi:transketolase